MPKATTSHSAKPKPVLVKDKMHFFGVLLWLTGVIRLHKDGDGFGGVMRAWHPLTWLTLLLMIIPCALLGEKLFDMVPLKLSKFWKEHKDQLQRVTPFTKLESLVPFVHNKSVNRKLVSSNITSS